MDDGRNQKEMLRFWLNRAHELVGGAIALTKSKTRDYTIKAAEEMVSNAEECLETIRDKADK